MYVASYIRDSGFGFLKERERSRLCDIEPCKGNNNDNGMMDVKKYPQIAQALFKANVVQVFKLL